MLPNPGDSGNPVLTRPYSFAAEEDASLRPPPYRAGARSSTEETGWIPVRIEAISIDFRIGWVRFEGDGLDGTAHLKFKDGSSETVHGETARKLHQHLSGVGSINGSSSAVKPESSDADVHEPPTRPFNLIVTTTPMLGRNQAWFYGKAKSGKRSCSERPFDAKTGFALGKRYVSGNYQEKFADLIEGATELTVDVQPSLERDCKQRLEQTFAHLSK